MTEQTTNHNERAREPLDDDARRMEAVAEVRTAVDEMGWQNLRVAERLLAPYRITFPQVIVLALLQEHGPDLEMSRIAAQTSLPASSITSVMDRLVARGWAERHHSETDRRRITASITDDGTRLLEELAALRDASFSRVMEQFSLDELQQLASFIRRWMAIIDETEEPE
jgi:DNA-binding MarR family transcriptional regulator